MHFISGLHINLVECMVRRDGGRLEVPRTEGRLGIFPGSGMLPGGA